jgi:hypothetical protein
MHRQFTDTDDVVNIPPNARPERPPEAGARDERTLEAVSSRPLFGSLCRGHGYASGCQGGRLMHRLFDRLDCL